MSHDEQQRAAYADLVSVAATIDRYGGWLSENAETAALYRAIRGPLAALVDLLCIRIGAYRPDQRQEQWWQRMP